MADSKKIDDGGPAFGSGVMPHPTDPNKAVPVAQLSVRDWFAGQMLPRIGMGWPNDENKMILARHCYEIADAMIAARKAGA